MAVAENIFKNQSASVRDPDTMMFVNGPGSDGQIRPPESRVDDRDRTRVRPSDLWWAVFAATLIPASLIWDFSWESTIGVDRFWSPPHLATHVGVWLSGLLGIRLLVGARRSRRRGERTLAVNLGPLCAPSGAWVLLWGAGLMQAAFLLDNWWQ